MYLHYQICLPQADRDFASAKSISTRISNFALLLFLISLNIHAQNGTSYTPKVSNIPTSPEASLLGRFGDIPVGFYTGTANISIPIYTIKEGDVEIPIELRYHSSGIKVADEATWVGLGWDLSPGGSIIQEVRGKTDETDDRTLLCFDDEYNRFVSRFTNSGSVGTYKVIKQIGKAFYNWDCRTVCYNGCIVPNIWVGEPVESETPGLVFSLQKGNGDPDIYHYNFGKFSGKFYINPRTKEIVVIDKKQAIKIQKDDGAFKITTQDGTIYTFKAIETAYGHVSQIEYDERAGKTYKISEVKFINGKTVNFNYTDAHISSLSFKQSAIVSTVDYFYVPNNQSPELNSVPIAESDLKILTSINSPDAEIIFNLESRDDINLNVAYINNNNQKRLRSIDIKSSASNKIVKSFEFGYSYFGYNTIGTPTQNVGTTMFVNSTTIPVLGKRLKLDSLKEIGYDDSSGVNVAVRTKPAYKFEYNVSATMPLKVSNAIDFYGYYNGAANSSLLPNLDYFDYPYLYMINNNNIPFRYYAYAKANRFTNNDFAGLYMLNKITYPTNGVTKFEYEPNSFTNKFIPDSSSKVYKQFTVAPGNTSSPTNMNLTYLKQDFILSKSTTINFTNKMFDGTTPYSDPTAPNYNPTTPSYPLTSFQDSKIVFSKTRVDASGQTTTTVIKQWDTSSILNVEFQNTHSKIWNEEIRINYESGCYYTVAVTNLVPYTAQDLNRLAGVESKFYFYDDTSVDTSISNQCGMRIKSIKNYDDNGILISNKRIKYFGGKLLTHFEPVRRRTIHCFKCTQGSINPRDCNCPSFLSTPPTTEFSVTSTAVNSGGTLVGYDRVEEIDIANNYHNTILDAKNTLGKKVYMFKNFENLSSNWFPDVSNLSNGLPLQNEVYNAVGTLLSKTSFTYSNLNGAVDCFYGFNIIQNFLGNIDPQEFSDGRIEGRSKFSYYATPILSEWNMLTKKVNSEYFYGSEVKTTEDYTYDGLGNTKTVAVTDSKNDILKTQYYYANDHQANEGFEYDLIAKNATGIPIVTQQFKGTNLLSTNMVHYDMLQPKYIYSKKGNGVFEKKVTISKYDYNGNILQYNLENGTPVSFIIGHYATLPIAKIEGATFAEVSAALSMTEISLSLLTVAPINIRALLPNAMITTYTHKPLVGVTSITDPRENVFRYTYDAFGRLINTTDRDLNILSQNDYHFIPQN